MRRLIALASLVVLSATVASAHIGNPDVYFDGEAGPYKLSVTIRPPVVIPGVAEVEVRTRSAGVTAVRAVPVPLSNTESKLAPVPDALKRSDADRNFFTGSLWIMAAGSWQVRFTAEGGGGQGSMAVPLPSVALTTKKMDTVLGAGLGFLMVLLVGGLVLMIGASVREAKLSPEATPSPALAKRARTAMAITLAAVVTILFLGWRWWVASEDNYRRNIFSPMRMRAEVDVRRGELRLHLAEPETPVGSAPPPVRLRPAFFTRTVDDLLPDHNHLMHLYALREPGLDVVYHLHPEPSAPGVFRLALPEMEAGRYRLYADIVHANGFPETLVSTVEMPANLPVRPLTGDDACGATADWQAAPLNAATFALPDGYRMVWKLPGTQIRAKDPQAMTFSLLDSQGRPARDMALYMGMPGHAAFVKTDGKAFAHIHPSGTVAMASLMMAEAQLPQTGMSKAAGSMDDMAGMDHSSHAIALHQVPATVTFPYGFPSPGRYRFIIQMKHENTVETGIFDTVVQ